MSEDCVLIVVEVGFDAVSKHSGILLRLRTKLDQVILLTMQLKENPAVMSFVKACMQLIAWNPWNWYWMCESEKSLRSMSAV